MDFGGSMLPPTPEDLRRMRVALFRSEQSEVWIATRTTGVEEPAKRAGRTRTKKPATVAGF